MGWEVVEVVPITCLLSNLWDFYVYLLCHAMLVDVDWVSDIHDRCELTILMVYLRWELKHTSGWIEAPGYSRTCLSRHLGFQDLPIFLRTATQAQRDHKIIHARNFCVHLPHVHLGSVLSLDLILFLILIFSKPSGAFET